MNKGHVLQGSSPAQQMMALVNPNWWWEVTGLRSSPSPQLPLPATPAFFSGGSNTILPDHPYVPPAASSTASSSSPSSSSSWQDINNPELPESWSQLLLGGLASEDHKMSGNNIVGSLQDQLSPSTPFRAVDRINQENSMGSYNNIYGYSEDRSDFRQGSAAKPSTWSPIAPVSSSVRSSTTSVETNNAVVDLSKNKPGVRQLLRDRTHEKLKDGAQSCHGNNSANGGAQKKARAQPSSSQSTFKVRKEKLGDRITALHQLVSPFGKTDTASVLLEAIGYIRFLQSQIEALSTPYFGKDPINLKQPVQGEPKNTISEDPADQKCGDHEEDGEIKRNRLDLRSRGLCLVPVSCTLDVGTDQNHVLGADYWAAASYGSAGGVGLFH